jgi:toxin ParE1/3/4
VSYQLIFRRLAQIELEEALAWYAQPDIRMVDAFMADLHRVQRFLSTNPLLYQCVEGDMRRGNFKKFPYALFYSIDANVVNIHSCFHQSRNPKTRAQIVQ